MRISSPDGGSSFFDRQPEVYAAFNDFYGHLWTDGVVDQATKEVARLRNAKRTDCGI
jgi:hypothetical protein